MEVARHLPERTCVGCRTKTAKHELVRIARPPGGAPVIDRSATMPGRGTYVHPRRACVDRALKTGAVDRALRSTVGHDEARKLRGIVDGKQGNA
ncbi:MAG: YlxR family protein [Actinomycetota bacterium]